MFCLWFSCKGIEIAEHMIYECCNDRQKHCRILYVYIIYIIYTIRFVCKIDKPYYSRAREDMGTLHSQQGRGVNLTRNYLFICLRLRKYFWKYNFPMTTKSVCLSVCLSVQKNCQTFDMSEFLVNVVFFYFLKTLLPSCRN